MSSYRLPIFVGVLCILLVAANFALVGYFSSPAEQPLAAAEASTPPTAPASDPFRECTESMFPGTLLGDRANAEQTVAACSTAIQSGTLGPNDLAAARLNRAAARIASGDRIMATADYEEALRRFQSTVDPAMPDALAIYRRGAALEGLGRTDEALSAYDEAIRLDPQGPLAYYGRAILLATRERAYVRAIADLDKVLALLPDNVSALQRRGDAYSQIGDMARAMVDFDRALALDPADPRGHVYRGFAYQRQGKPAQAIEDFDAALKDHPHYFEALQARGALYVATGDLDHALRDFDQATTISPHNAAAFFNRGYVNFLKKKYDLAVLDYGTAIYFEPEMGVAYNNRCLALAVADHTLVNALADCDRALKLMPSNADVRETRGFVYLKLGDPGIAKTEYEEALRLDPNRPLALYGLGLAKIRLGLAVEGKALQDAAIALYPAIRNEFAPFGLD